MSRLTSRLDDLCVALTGQDAVVVYHQLQAIAANVISWLLVLLRVRVPALRLGRKGADSAVLVLSPGGFERFALEPLPVESVVTVGYNVTAPTVERLPTCNSLARLPDGPPPGHAIVRIKAFSVNYADVTIRWGLYESAIKYVGYPICPGFDLAGVVERVGPGASVQEGDTVVGITFFGAYSERVLVPCHQLFAVPKGMSIAQAAALPSVSGTALHALALAGLWPSLPASRNRAVLVHSAAGGVGSMLVQMAKAIGCHPIVAVVGASHKVAACEALGATAVIDKSKEDLWSAASKAAPGGYCAIFDANGVQTLARSYSALAQTGTLVIYGFHTNLPTSSMLNPLAWARMLVGILRMPRFDPMDLVLSSKSVAGFNLSFFADETRMVGRYFEQILAWVEDGSLALSNVTTFPMDELPRAHDAIQSGQSIGKLVCLTRHAGD
uniref:Enoyl reductase (ER) domain-containing protein n=1 Tax=Emiliania huxleyi TaxID=2903 RepID=A0A7S3WNV1_EMIHU